MATFLSAIEAFASGRLRFEELTSELDRQLSTTPDQAQLMLAQLEEFNKQKTLPSDIYSILSSRILRCSDQFNTANAANTTDRSHPMPNLSSKAEAATRIVSATVGQSSTPGAEISRHMPSEAETVVTPALDPSELSKLAKVDASRSKTLGPGTILKHRFVLEEVIGAGGMSVVFKARDLRKEEAQDADPYVAMKVLGEDFKAHPASLKVLQQETTKAQDLAHPNIVNVYDFDRDGNTIYMTMECLEGETLDEIIKRVPPQGMPLNKALPYIEGMVQALAHAHKRGIVHSDFKPGNVFYTTDTVVKVLDFGIARARKHKDGRDATVFDPGSLGALTPAYASCEMLEGQEPDPRDDIYALACITYELLTGRHPFNRAPAVEARNANMKPARIKGLKRRQWLALVEGLAFEREDRTADALKVLADLKPRAPVRTQTLILGSLLVTLLGYYAYERTRITPEEYLPPPVKLTASQKARIAELQETAEFYLAAGYLAVPPGDNAHDIYKKILEIDPRDKSARQGIQKIADKYEEMARLAWESGETDSARTNITLGLSVNSSHKGLQALDKQLGTSRTAR